MLNNLTGTPQYVNWISDLLRPYLGDTVLEVGAGLGTLSGRLMARRLGYVAGEADPLYLHALRNRFLRTPNVSVVPLDPRAAADYRDIGEPFDTVLCLNLLEYQENPGEVIAHLAGVLSDTGKLIVLAPHTPSLYSSIDRALGHRRRFSIRDIAELLAPHGLEVEAAKPFNRAAKPVWWMQGKLFRRQGIGKPVLKLFDETVWFWRLIEPLLPWQGLSLIVVARRRVR